ncbi:hypothetical protein AVEN_134660-1 [Araneus ventricosus]|uniref:Chitin-binding type-2 domain-containing protein n=1 Tax=Araneus ventricosus TaxID=182803 RepID=A0A4Y2F6P5_ARAVE|nr:hypothetical protein AVEN_134660-1 [Araneus ventricosus]
MAKTTAEVSTPYQKFHTTTEGGPRGTNRVSGLQTWNIFVFSQVQQQVAKMGICSAFLFCLLIGIAISEEVSIGDSSQDSLVPVTIFVTAEQYEACKEYGDCTFTPQSVSLNESGEIHGKLEGKSYFELCRKIHFKMEKLEAEHPEVKYLKLKFIQMFDSYSSEFDFESEKGELVGMKILDFVKNLIEKLKVELKDKLHKPEPIPTIETTTSEEEITAEPETGHPMLVGSIRGIPGIHFPNYTEIPITSFSCSDKTLIPGFYADLETGCQVFHLCYEHRRESFLCPIGTIFNQPILACDYWYSANCSLAPIYYEDPNIPEPEKIPIVIEEIVKHPKKDVVSKDFLQFLPVKAKVADIPKFDKPIKTPKLKPVTLEDTEVIADKIFDGILSLGSKVISKTSDMLHKIPDPQYEAPIVSKSFPFEDKLASKAFSAFGKAKKLTSAAKLTGAAKIASAAAFTSGKAKIASFAALPMVKAKVASAAALPMVKAKVASAAALPMVKAKVALAAALPMAKTKVAAASIPLVKAKTASMKIPIVKGKLFTLPLAKTKLGAAAIPALKAKKTAMAVPYLKMAALKPKFVVAPLKVKSAIALPMMKTKLAKAAISPLTKKALALGYLKLLKAKKLAVMG